MGFVVQKESAGKFITDNIQFFLNFSLGYHLFYNLSLESSALLKFWLYAVEINLVL